MATCLNVSSHLSQEFGGIVTSIPPLCNTLELAGRYRAPLAAFCSPDEEASQNKNEFAIHRLPRNPIRWLADASLRSDFYSLTREASLCHIHGIWETHSAVASHFARRLGRPYVVSAHGMLDAWALQQKRWKKKIYSELLEFRNLSSAACLRAMTHHEAEQYIRFGLKNPIAIIPNGVEIPASRSPHIFLERYPHLRGKQIALFLGRIHTKKGLFPLCRSWQVVSRRLPDAHLVIAGPDSEGIKSELQRVVSSEKTSQSVTFTGLLSGDLKWSAYEAASVFALPSYSEGFSIAVLESLGTGTPVIVSEACYFGEIPAYGAGWVTAVTEPGIAQTLLTALSSPADTLKAMGKRGADLVAEKYSWSEIASQFADLYDWILGGSLPSSFPIVFHPKR
jgi:glycosyltransferase involved in cell wall biosynthesis